VAEDSIRRRFPIGCRVVFNASAREIWTFRKDVPATVVGYTMDRQGLRIVRDGNTHVERFSAHLLTRVDRETHPLLAEP
jgi:hypothetical protein